MKMVSAFSACSALRFTGKIWLCEWKSAVTSASVRIVILGDSSYGKEVLYSKCMVDLSKDKRVPLSLVTKVAHAD